MPTPGRRAGAAARGSSAGTQLYDPKDEGPCPNVGLRPAALPRLFGSPATTSSTTCSQYWFGGYVGVLDDGIDEATGEHFDAVGVDIPFGDLRWGFGGPRQRRQPGRRAHRSSPRAASCRPTEFPQFRSWPSSRWDKPGGPFDPHTGEQFVYSQIADVAYKRLTREIAVPASGGSR